MNRLLHELRLSQKQLRDQIREAENKAMGKHDYHEIGLLYDQLNECSMRIKSTEEEFAR